MAARGPFGRLACEGLEREARSLGVSIAASSSFADTPERIAVVGADAVLACGPFDRELELFRALRSRPPQTVLGGVSPGLSAFPADLGQDPEGIIAVAQWHPALGAVHGSGRRRPRSWARRERAAWSLTLGLRPTLPR